MVEASWAPGMRAARHPGRAPCPGSGGFGMGGSCAGNEVMGEMSWEGWTVGDDFHLVVFLEVSRGVKGCF